MMARFCKFLFFAALFSLSDASGIKNRDEEPLKVRAKKYLSLPNSNRKINPRSLNQKRDLQLFGGIFGFNSEEEQEGVVSHSSDEISVSVDEDTFFLVALILLFFALFFGAGTSPTSPSTPTHAPTMDPVGSLSLPTANPTISSAPSLSAIPTM